jgi:hypothetical protein
MEMPLCAAFVVGAIMPQPTSSSKPAVFPQSGMAASAMRDIKLSPRSGQQTLTRNMVELKPDTIGIFEQQRIVSRRPTILTRLPNDPGIDRAQESVQLIDIGTLPARKHR